MNSNGCCEISRLCPMQTESSFSLLPSLTNQAPPFLVYEEAEARGLLASFILWRLSSFKLHSTLVFTDEAVLCLLPLNPSQSWNPLLSPHPVTLQVTDRQLGWIYMWWKKPSDKGFPGCLNPSFSKIHPHLLSTYYMQHSKYCI